MGIVKDALRKELEVQRTEVSRAGAQAVACDERATRLEAEVVALRSERDDWRRQRNEAALKFADLEVALEKLVLEAGDA